MVVLFGSVSLNAAIGVAVMLLTSTVLASPSTPLRTLYKKGQINNNRQFPSSNKWNTYSNDFFYDDNGIDVKDSDVVDPERNKPETEYVTILTDYPPFVPAHPIKKPRRRRSRRGRDLRPNKPSGHYQIRHAIFARKGVSLTTAKNQNRLEIWQTMRETTEKGIKPNGKQPGGYLNDPTQQNKDIGMMKGFLRMSSHVDNPSEQVGVSKHIDRVRRDSNPVKKMIMRAYQFTNIFGKMNEIYKAKPCLLNAELDASQGQSDFRPIPEPTSPTRKHTIKVAEINNNSTQMNITNVIEEQKHRVRRAAQSNTVEIEEEVHKVNITIPQNIIDEILSGKYVVSVLGDKGTRIVIAVGIVTFFIIGALVFIFVYRWNVEEQRTRGRNLMFIEHCKSCRNPMNRLHDSSDCEWIYVICDCRNDRRKGKTEYMKLNGGNHVVTMEHNYSIDSGDSLEPESSPERVVGGEDTPKPPKNVGSNSSVGVKDERPKRVSSSSSTGVKNVGNEQTKGSTQDKGCMDSSVELDDSTETPKDNDIDASAKKGPHCRKQNPGCLTLPKIMCKFCRLKTDTTFN
ncbi:unnamed protein product [Owenia fusiformis]|uniref:Uncharacterized protein n=1 Tax=Owenia fusiformis TaxID=6347 RepID=A0A8J1U032_OWEFU|nr:unnamed protein product [Owenia fusiformis]